MEIGSHRELLAKNGAYARMVASYSAGIGELPQPEAEVLSPVPERALEPASNPHEPSTDPRNLFLRLLGFLKESWGWVALSVLLSSLTIGASVALMGTSAWLISTAALHPSIADLGVSVVGVRFFGISRGVFRYLERLVSHNVTFHLLARLRVWFYEKLEPLAPARLMEFRSGDLLARIVEDVGTLENFYIRVISPPITAVLIAAVAALFLASRSPLLALNLIGFFILLGLVLPLLSQQVTRRASREVILRRAALNVLLVDGIQGLADLLAFNRAGDTLESLAREQPCLRRLSEPHRAPQRPVLRVERLPDQPGHVDSTLDRHPSGGCGQAKRRDACLPHPADSPPLKPSPPSHWPRKPGTWSARPRAACSRWWIPGLRCWTGHRPWSFPRPRRSSSQDCPLPIPVEPC